MGQNSSATWDSSFTPNLKLQEVRFWSVRRIGQIFVAMGLSIKYVTLFLANFDPSLPSSTLCHTSRDSPKVRHTSLTPRFLVGLVQKTQTKAPCTNSISIVRGGFCPGFFIRVGFCPFPQY